MCPVDDDGDGDVVQAVGVLESIVPSGGVISVSVACDDGLTRTGSGDFNQTARALSESGISVGDRVGAGFSGWGGLMWIGPEFDEED